MTDLKEKTTGLDRCGCDGTMAFVVFSHTGSLICGRPRQKNLVRKYFRRYIPRGLWCSDRLRTTDDGRWAAMCFASQLHRQTNVRVVGGNCVCVRHRQTGFGFLRAQPFHLPSLSRWDGMPKDERHTERYLIYLTLAALTCGETRVFCLNGLNNISPYFTSPTPSPWSRPCDPTLLISRHEPGS